MKFALGQKITSKSFGQGTVTRRQLSTDRGPMYCVQWDCNPQDRCWYTGSVLTRIATDKTTADDVSRTMFNTRESH